MQAMKFLFTKTTVFHFLPRENYPLYGIIMVEICVLYGIIAMSSLIQGRVFAFIAVRRTTRPGTSCLRMRQIFIVFVVGKNISLTNKNLSIQKMHIGSCFTMGVAGCAAA